MKYLLPLLILIDFLNVQGILEWTVIGKVTDYGQNVTLFCHVPHCCPKDSGWDRWTPVQQTLFIDVKTGRPYKKYDGKVMKDGYTLIIQNLTKNDLNVSYSCLYGVTLGERKFLLEEDVFNPISPTLPDVPNGQLSQSEISALIIGVIVLVLGSVTISIYLWRRRIKINKSTGKSGSYGIKVNSLDIETDQQENEDCSDPTVKLLEKVTEQKVINIGEHCTTDSNCTDTINGSECSSCVCKCIDATHYNYSNACVKKGTHGEACDPAVGDGTCLHSLRCISDTCTCNDTHISYFYNDVCYPKIAYGSNCTLGRTGQCFGDHTECKTIISGDVCLCKTNYWVYIVGCVSKDGVQVIAPNLLLTVVSVISTVVYKILK